MIRVCAILEVLFFLLEVLLFLKSPCPLSMLAPGKLGSWHLGGPFIRLEALLFLVSASSWRCSFIS